jgi:hypothetical protein
MRLLWEFPGGKRRATRHWKMYIEKSEELELEIKVLGIFTTTFTELKGMRLFTVFKCGS